MVELNPLRWWRGLLALPNTSRLKAIVVVLLVSVTCAIVVSVTGRHTAPAPEGQFGSGT